MMVSKRAHVVFDLNRWIGRPTGPKLFPWVPDDGGRAEAGYKGHVGDCVTRALAIATGRPYQEIYDDLNRTAVCEIDRFGYKVSSARNGVAISLTRVWLELNGWTWHPTMFIGSGCRVHLVPSELPAVPVLIAQVSKHIVAIKNGIIYDTGDPSREGTRCVYGYWTKGD